MKFIKKSERFKKIIEIISFSSTKDVRVDNKQHSDIFTAYEVNFLRDFQRVFLVNYTNFTVPYLVTAGPQFTHIYLYIHMYVGM